MRVVSKKIRNAARGIDQIDWRDITRALAETHAILIDAGIVEVKP